MNTVLDGRKETSRRKNERRHKYEVGAPKTRIMVPLELVLPPRDNCLNPVFGPVVTAQGQLTLQNVGVNLREEVGCSCETALPHFSFGRVGPLPLLFPSPCPSPARGEGTQDRPFHMNANRCKEQKGDMCETKELTPRVLFEIDGLSIV